MAHIQTQSEWETEMSEKILQFIRHELYLELRHLEPALSALAYRRTDGLLTFAADGRCLYYSTEPVLRIFQKNSAFLDRAYLHTILHCLFKHLWMMPGVRSDKAVRNWNIACDIAVEYTIDSMNIVCTKRILSWIRRNIYDIFLSDRNEKLSSGDSSMLSGRKKKSHGMSAAIIFRWLREQEEERILELAREFYTDDHRFWPEPKEQETPVQVQARQNWDKTARQVTLEQSRRGDDPKEGEEVFAAQLCSAKSRRSYREFLQKFAVLQEEAHLDPEEFELGYYSYGLRLYGNLPLIEPLETREVQKIREFVIVIDTSYSTSGELVEGFLKETFSILSQKNSFFRQFCIRILQCDNQVRMDDTIHSDKELDRLLAEFQIVGGGGTDFRPAFAYVDDLLAKGEIKQLGGLLYFTDGKGIYPKKQPEYKTAFLFLEDYEEEAVPPWAMRLAVEPEEWIHEY